MRVLALASYPVESAATRFRIHQLQPILRRRGIHVELAPFLDGPAYRALYDRRRIPTTVAGVGRGLMRRVRDVSTARRYDAVLVQREAMLGGPPVVEALIAGAARTPMVLDLDDATWLAYDSPTYGPVARFVKWPGKSLALIDRAAVVTCGSSTISEFVEQRGARARVVPPAADTETFRPRWDRQDRHDGELVVGWIGTHSTWRYLEPLIPMLRSLHREVPFRLRVVGAGSPSIDSGLLPIDNLEWSLVREPDDFAGLHVGLYPLPDEAWARGKSGLKSVQYLACGVPFVASPVGGAAEIGLVGTTHLQATTLGQWRESLYRLLTDEGLRQRMGRAGRAHAVARHTVDHAAHGMGQALVEAAG